MNDAHTFWQTIESIHAVTYFADESKQAATDAGLKGFWMGYFGCRAAPLGRATAGLVDATFANFAPSMVRRSVPDVWDYADPDTLITVRARAAAAALRGIVPAIAEIAVTANPALAEVIATGSPLGRPLYGANRGLHAQFDDPVERLWQLTTAFREHRGDGHLMALASADIDGCEAHVLAAGITGTDHAVYRASRGWSDDAWAGAITRLENRGLLLNDVATPAGVHLHRSIETQTDRLALTPPDALAQHLAPAARHVARSGVISFPNPMGLPAPAE